MAHVKIQENVSSSESEDYSDQTDEEMSDSKEDNQATSKGGGLADVMAAILTKTVPQNKVILAKGQTDKEIQIRQRKRARELGTLPAEDEQEEKEAQERKEKKEKIEKKKAWNNLNRVKPNPLEREKERRLQRIATRGVVQLFNAVRQQQKTLEEKLEAAGSSIKKTDKVLGSMTKGKFLDLLKGTTPSTKENGKQNKTKEKLEDSSDTKWKILRDDFMMGAKMKDWDKDSDSADNSSESDHGGGDMDSDSD